MKPDPLHGSFPRAAKTGRSSAVTIREVARKAGVSIGTVSRFLNGYSLKEKTATRVAQTISELGYRQNVIAKGMKTRRTYSVGVLFPIFDEFHTEILSKLEQFFTRRGYQMVVSQYEHDEHAMEDKLRFMRERYADGLVLSPGRAGISQDLARECRKLIETGVPVITFNNRVTSLENDHVHVNDAESVQQAVEYLFNMNHRDIAILSGMDVFSTARERLTGYQQAMERHGVAEEKRIVLSGHWSFNATGYQLGKRMMSLARKPTAVFVSNCILMFGLLEYLHESELRIPEDISVVSFDDPQIFKLHRPGITAVRQPNEGIAKAVADLMIRRLAGDWSQYPVDIRIPTELILRDSVKKR